MNSCRRIVVSFLLTSGACFAQQYLISTFAGGPPPLAPGMPQSATIGSPQGVAIDSARNVYFSGVNSIWKLGSNGTLARVVGTTYASYSGDGGAASSAGLSSPGGLAIDSAGNLYIADAGNNRVRKVSLAGTISTVAGNGTAGYSGDGGQAAKAELNGPAGVIVDSAGNLYIADTMNNVVRMVSPSGTISTVAGGGAAFIGDGGPATSAQLSTPAGLAVDSGGNLYIADAGFNRVRKVAPGGTITTVAGAGSASYWGDGGPATGAQLNNPGSVSLDAAGNLYIADTGNNRVREVSGGIINTIAGGSGNGYSGDGGAATSALLNAPQGAAVDSSGNLYIADSGNYVIREVTPSGAISTVAWDNSCCFPLGDFGPAASARLSAPQGVALGVVAGTVYIGENGAGRVRKVGSSGSITTLAGTGSYGYSGDGGLAASAQLSNLVGVAGDTAGNVYIADTGNSRIRMVSPGGIITTAAGTGSAGNSGDGGLAVNAQLDLPFGVVLDAAGDLYIADAGAHRIRKVAPGGIIITVAGTGTLGYSGDGGPAVNAELNAPSGIAADGSGDLFIADTQNNVVRKVSAAGVITTLAGNGRQGYSGDGGLATSAALNLPVGVAVDGAGNVFIADTGNNRVRKVSTTGVITTVAGTGTSGYSGDGGPSVSAQLNSPYGLAVDGAGKVYVADSGNGAVRVLLPATGATVSIVSAALLPSGTIGVAYSQTLTAAGGTSPYTWSVTSGTLPAGLALSAAGLITGTPTTAGTSTFLITVSDANSLTATQSFSLTVGSAGISVVITTTTLPSAVSGTAYSQTLAATGGVAPYTWSISSGALPPGLGISTGGVIAGTPTATGVYSFTVQAQDSASLTASQAFSLTVTAAGSLSRLGVFSQLATGGGWDTTIWLVNRTSGPVSTSLVFHGDDGSPLSLSFTVTQPGVTVQTAASTLNEVIAPNTTLVVATGVAGSAVVEGWVDVLGSGALSGFAVFRDGGASEAAVPLETQIGSSVSLPFDNTGGYSTGIAIVNLGNSQAAIVATIWDENGNLLAQQPVTLTKSDANGGGHDSFMLPARLTATAGKRGIVQFQGNPGSPFTPSGALAGLGLKTDPNGLFTSIPVIVP